MRIVGVVGGKDDGGGTAGDALEGATGEGGEGVMIQHDSVEGGMGAPNNLLKSKQHIDRLDTVSADVEHLAAGAGVEACDEGRHCPHVPRGETPPVQHHRCSPTPARP